LLDEDRRVVLPTARRARSLDVPANPGSEPLSARGKPFALRGVRILDFAWFLASAGGTRFLAAMGAESIKVELKSHPDTRLAAMAPIGGRDARRHATAPLPGVTDPDMGGQFNNKNPGKRGISLNVRHPKGLEIARRLVAMSDIVAEGFSPGVMDRWGLGYDALRSIRPDIIYAQQSGMGSHGVYGRVRTVGPIAASFAGISEMSGLPEPAMPAGWGYSYLDWIGAYSFALAMLSALYHRARTGEGQRIDASQCECGLFLNGTAILDWSANGRVWSRYGNRSPYKPAAPHGAYRCRGDDRWLAIACFADDEWLALAAVAAHPEWCEDSRFASLAARLANQDALDAIVSAWTRTQEAFDAMSRLQSAGVPAGVCQTAEDRCERDPQLRALEWLTEVTGTKIGRWPVAEVPVKMSESPPYVGGPIDRGAPCYGEDNAYVYGELLGMSAREIAALADEGVI
jgi:crotonobetainyl-CoA:carnitine CoA-transferase CaiB-like acyl-CoA transferase